ncbi:2',3'-cyclic-nucleotide 3'-phosphodiesterase [Peziza echinospora]|nr:2',3'-cyclic-nucleotide 3'-phosphodiesterase [Peziza echinospora]
MGASLWLLPPSNSPLDTALNTLINTTIPTLFPGTTLPHFRPHITLTSDVDPSLDPTTVTSAITIPGHVQPPPPVSVKFTGVVVGERFFTKVTLYVEKTEGLVGLAGECRRRFVTREEDGSTGEEARRWAQEEYTPHLSLVYMDEGVGEEVRRRIEGVVREAGVGFGEGVEAWKGGRIVLVNCSRPIEEWKVEGERDLAA